MLVKGDPEQAHWKLNTRIAEGGISYLSVYFIKRHIVIVEFDRKVCTWIHIGD